MAIVAVEDGQSLALLATGPLLEELLGHKKARTSQDGQSLVLLAAGPLLEELLGHKKGDALSVRLSAHPAVTSYACGDLTLARRSAVLKQKALSKAENSENILVPSPEERKCLSARLLSKLQPLGRWLARGCGQA